MSAKKTKVGDDLLAELDTRISLSDILSESEKEDVRKKAREHVREAQKEKAIKALLAKEIKRAERELVPEEQTIDIFIDLPAFAPMVRLDNVVYFHGLTYEVPISTWQSMRDVIARAWEHQNEINGHSRMADVTRRHFVTRLSPSAPHGTKLSSIDSMRS